VERGDAAAAGGATGGPAGAGSSSAVKSGTTSPTDMRDSAQGSGSGDASAAGGATGGPAGAGSSSAVKSDTTGTQRQRARQHYRFAAQRIAARSRSNSGRSGRRRARDGRPRQLAGAHDSGSYVKFSRGADLFAQYERWRGVRFDYLQTERLIMKKLPVIALAMFFALG
jgi:hypothetical protein